MVDTVPQRRYQLVARKTERELSVPLLNIDMIEEVRAEKRKLEVPTLSIDENESILDSQIKYEIHNSETSGPTANMQELVRPHYQSDKDGGYLHDGILLTVAKLRNNNLSASSQWVFSAQSLHQLGLISGVDLFWRPEEVLKDKATEFQLKTRDAMQKSEGAGFEAVLEVTMVRSGQNTSPRRFSAIPDLDNTKVEIKGDPWPLQPTG